MIMEHRMIYVGDTPGSVKVRAVCSCGSYKSAVGDRLSAQKAWGQHAYAMLRDADERLAVFTRDRRRVMVLTQPELLELVEILREVDQVLDVSVDNWHASDAGFVSIRDRLEDVLGLRRGGLKIN